MLLSNIAIFYNGTKEINKLPGFVICEKNKCWTPIKHKYLNGKEKLVQVYELSANA